MQGDASIENETWSCSFLILLWGDYPAMFSVEDERGVKVGYLKRVEHQRVGKLDPWRSVVRLSGLTECQFELVVLHLK